MCDCGFRVGVISQEHQEDYQEAHQVFMITYLSLA